MSGVSNAVSKRPADKPSLGKYSINQRDDPLELQADRIADEVLRMPGTGLLSAPPGGAPIHRKCGACEAGGTCCPTCSLGGVSRGIIESNRLQRQPFEDGEELLQRQPIEEEEEELQLKPRVGPAVAAPDDNGSIKAVEAVCHGGSPLPAPARGYFEPRFGRDLSDVRVHTGQAANQATAAVNARAFTLGSSIAFAPGQFDPSDSRGRRLLAHELTHVVQQGRKACRGPVIGRMPVTGPVIQRSPTLPGYSQKGDTCGAASLVTALMIYDKQKGNHDASIAAIENILTWLIQHKSATIKGWDKKGIDGKAKFTLIKSFLESVRDSLLAGSDISELQYQTIGMALYFLYIDRTSGLSSLEIENLQNKLGLYSGKSDLINTGADVFSNSIVTGLKPDQIAQLGWYVKTSGPDSKRQYTLGHHAFLVGRLNTGEWYLHDQGPRPAARYVNITLSGLEQHVRAESAADKYWLFFGTFTMRVAGGWTGAKLLEGGHGPENKQAGLVPSGTYLAEIDYSSLRFGDKLNSGKYLGVAHSRANGYFICGSSGSVSKGRLMVEMPKGVFLVYEINSISSHNMKATTIDASEGGSLTRKTFYSAELILTDGNVCKKIKVY